MLSQTGWIYGSEPNVGTKTSQSEARVVVGYEIQGITYASILSAESCFGGMKRTTPIMSPKQRDVFSY